MGELDDVMTLLAISIVADGRVVSEEVEVFTKAATQLRLSELVTTPPSEESAGAWFTKYHADIRAVVFGPRPEYEARLKVLLDRVADHVRPDALLHTLHMISISDGEMHPSETRLISFIKHHWRME